jgi:hypothetical protein
MLQIKKNRYVELFFHSIWLLQFFGPSGFCVGPSGFSVGGG